MALDPQSATRLAQQLLMIGTPALKQDGWWGTYTNQAFLSASAEIQGAVRVVLKEAGTSPEELLAGTRKIAARAGSLGAGWLDATYVNSLIDRAAAQYNGDAALMRRFLLVEAGTMMRDGVMYFNARSVSPNGMYRGLFQMGRDAWSDARKLVVDLSDFASGAFDPWENTRAAMAYSHVLMKYAREKGFKGDFTPEVLYALHNQGAAGFMKLLREQRPNAAYNVQSASARLIIQTALGQSGVRLA